MFIDIENDNKSSDFFDWNGTNPFFYVPSTASYYDKYIAFAVCSALLGLPSNILLLVILMRIGLFSKRQSSLSNVIIKPTGSFERFLFEVVFIDTLLIIYHFVDNVLSYLHEDRSAGQHYLIHISDFCCKFFTYIAKMSVLLITWLLLFLIINQLILSMEYNNNHRSFWTRGLYYVNAKYSTVFLVFIFSVYNIYPIEVLKYEKKEGLQDYQQEGVPGVCRASLEGKSKQLLNVTNYGYHLLGLAIPCVIIFIISIIIIYRTCRNSRYTNKEGTSFHYIAGTIGIIHSLFMLPGRFSDILLMFLSPHASFFPSLISFNHEAQSFLSLSYGYKFFVCIYMSRRFRLHAKSVLCFLIENKYEDRHTIEIVNTTNGWQHLSKRKKHKLHHHHHHYTKDSQVNKIPLVKPTSKNFSSSYINKEDLLRYATSETTYWIRPYFTQNEKHHQLRPCGRSASCHQISTTIPSLPSPIVGLPKKYSPHEVDTSSSSYIVSISLPSGEYIHLPLPQKRASNHRSSLVSSSLLKNQINPPSYKVSQDLEKQPINRINCLSSTHLY